MNAIETEAQLRDRLLSDPERGWTDFWSRYEGFVKNLIRKYHLSLEDSADIFQEVSLRLAKDQSKLLRVWNPDRCSLKGFLAVMVTSVCLNFLKSSYFRYSKLKVDLEAEDLFQEDPAPSPAERLDRLEAVRTIRRLVQRAVEKGDFRRDDAWLVELRLGGMSYPEIARLLDTPAETLGTRFHRLKEKLRKDLQLAGIDPTGGQRS